MALWSILRCGDAALNGLLTRTTQCITNPLGASLQSVLTEQRRFTKPAYRWHPPAWSNKPINTSWWQKKYAPRPVMDSDLTQENREFLEEKRAEIVRQQQSEVQSPLKEQPWPRYEWTSKPMTIRTGVVGVKLGTLRQYTKEGRGFLCTLVQVLDCHAIRYVPPERLAAYRSVQLFRKKWIDSGYGVQVVGALSCDPREFTPEYSGLFRYAGVPPKRFLTRFRITPNAAVQPGTPLTAMHFNVGNYVDVEARTINHGFQGGMKRWGMKGGPATHGATKWHRRMGSLAGAHGAVYRGKRMPGIMGNVHRTISGLRIWRINTRYNVLYINGRVPGPPKCMLRVMDSLLPKAVEMRIAKPPTMPSTLPGDVDQSKLPVDLCHPDLFTFSQPSVVFPEELRKATATGGTKAAKAAAGAGKAAPKASKPAAKAPAAKK